MAEVITFRCYWEIKQFLEVVVSGELPENMKRNATEYLFANREQTPEWIKILANGDLELWPSVLDEARIEYELMQREAEQEKE